MKIENPKIQGLDERLNYLQKQTNKLDAAIQKAENMAEEIIQRQQYETNELLKVGFLGITVVAAYAAVQAVFELVYSK